MSFFAIRDWEEICVTQENFKIHWRAHSTIFLSQLNSWNSSTYTSRHDVDHVSRTCPFMDCHDGIINYVNFSVWLDSIFARAEISLLKSLSNLLFWNFFFQRKTSLIIVVYENHNYVTHEIFGHVRASFSRVFFIFFSWLLMKQCSVWKGWKG